MQPSPRHPRAKVKQNISWYIIRYKGRKGTREAECVWNPPSDNSINILHTFTEDIGHSLSIGQLPCEVYQSTDSLEYNL